MKKILDQFVPYDIAVALKEAGFDEPCFATSNLGVIVGVLDTAQFKVTGFQFVKNSEAGGPWIAAPLYQQVFDWLELNNLRIHDCWIFYEQKWSVSIFNMPTGNQMWPNHLMAAIEPGSILYTDKREAWNIAIREAIKLL